jgi:triacylglycerol lipase
MAQASSIAYKLEKSLGSVERFVKSEWGMEDFHFIQKDDTECFIAANKDVIFLVFQGTEKSSLRDWITDCKFRKRLGPWNLGVHRGFKTALEIAWDEIDALIENLNKRAKRPLFITGHSLGGALATLAAAQCVEERIPVNAMYTFGQPMAGNSSFAEKFDRVFKSAYRFVNNEDIVTRIPFELFNFSHVGCLCYFDNRKKLHIQPEKSFVFRDRYEGVEVRSLQNLRHLRHLYPNEVDDHKIEEYIYNIEKALKEKSWETRPEGGFLKYINQ